MADDWAVKQEMMQIGWIRSGETGFKSGGSAEGRRRSARDSGIRRAKSRKERS